jgi:F-type H+-transporting ATPase subunit b
LSVFASLVSVAAAGAVEAHEEAASAGLPQLDPSSWPSQLFWLALTFGVLYWLMAGRFLPSLGGAIEERRDRVADDLDQASEFKRQAEEAEGAYNKSLADARAKAQSIAADTRAEMDEEIAGLQAETEAALENQLAAAEARISTMKKDAAAKVREAAAETARAVVETLIDEAPADEAVSKAIAAAQA